MLKIWQKYDFLFPCKIVFECSHTQKSRDGIPHLTKDELNVIFMNYTFCLTVLGKWL